MKRVIILLFAFAMLIGCQPTPEHDIVVQKDTERLVETVVAKNRENGSENAESDEASGNAHVKTDQHFTYEYTSKNKRLHIRADADVYMPESGKVPMARVKGEYFTNDFAKKMFDKVYQGTPAYIKTNEVRRMTKSELAEQIVYYQNLVDSHTTDEVKLISEEEAKALIEEWKEEYKTAPDEPIELVPELSDGSMKFYDVTNDSPYATWSHMQYYELWTTGEKGLLNIRRHAENDDQMADFLMYDRYTYDGTYEENIISYGESSEGRELMTENPYKAYVADAADQTCAYGQDISPYEAAETCRTFLADLGVTDVQVVPTVDTYIIMNNDQTAVLNCYYFINFVRTVNGTPAAYLSIMDVVDTGRKDQFEYPWEYEYLQFVFDRNGILHLSWDNPVQITKIVSNDAASLTFEQAASVFEAMSSIIYEAQTEQRTKAYYLDLEVSKVELSVIRIREKNAEGRTGLYVPAWVFYGKLTDNYDNPVTQEMIDRRVTTVLLVVNAIDGSIIDLQKGY